MYDCGGNEDLGQIEQVSVALTVVHSMVLLIAGCLAIVGCGTAGTWTRPDMCPKIMP